MLKKNIKKNFRSFLYHESGKKLFTNKEEYQQALEDGWVEAPWLVGKEPEKKPEIKPEPVAESKTIPEKGTCDICGEYSGTPRQVKAHKIHCAKRNTK